MGGDSIKTYVNGILDEYDSQVAFETVEEEITIEDRKFIYSTVKELSKEKARQKAANQNDNWAGSTEEGYSLKEHRQIIDILLSEHKNVEGLNDWAMWLISHSLMCRGKNIRMLHLKDIATHDCSALHTDPDKEEIIIKVPK